MLNSLKEGVFAANERGFGFFTPDDGSPRLFIPPDKMGGAWHGDRVSASDTGDPEGRGPTGSVEKILSRGITEITGRLCRAGKKAWLTPDDRRFPERVTLNKITPKHQDGDKVNIRITHYGEHRPPEGEITAVLGRDGTFAAAVEAVLYAQGIRRGFGNKAAAQARNTPVSVDEKMTVNRADLRDLLIFTIDGADAKDLDDAVSLTYDEHNRAVLGVHIADVSHYVQPNSALDAAAFSRGTSVYFANQAVPMLPVELSNGICSLHGGVDRLCVSVLMTLDENGKTLSSEIKLSVINSKARMTYGECNEILAGGRTHFIAETLLKMNETAHKMRAARKSGGALDIETPDCEIICGADGEPSDIIPRERGEAERLIEAFMLAANEAAANFLFWAESPCVYRVHPPPDSEKLKAFYALALAKGLKVKKNKNITGGSLQSILDGSKNLPGFRVLNTALLRGMMKAKYGAGNEGHFGLASDCYCHFTSPIRRYPDLMVHRCLKILLGFMPEPDAWKSRCGEAARQSTARELAADSAERLIEKLYKALYMKNFIGEKMEGVISGVQSYGFFVELPNTAEGLVSVSSLHGDIYEADESGLFLKGRVSGKKYEAGDTVTVLCAAADELTGRIDFELAD